MNVFPWCGLSVSEKSNIRLRFTSFFIHTKMQKCTAYFKFCECTKEDYAVYLLCFLSSRSMIILSVRESTMQNGWKCKPMLSISVFWTRKLIYRLSWSNSNDHPFYHKPGILKTYSHPDLNRTKTHDANKYVNNSCIVKLLTYSTIMTKMSLVLWVFLYSYFILYWEIAAS